MYFFFYTKKEKMYRLFNVFFSPVSPSYRYRNKLHEKNGVFP